MTNNTLAEALEPFAAKAEQFSKQGDGLVTIQMDFAHFRRASKALATLRASTDAAAVAGEDVRQAVARSVQRLYEVRDYYASDDYAPGQPASGFNERSACNRCINAIMEEFAMSSNEQRQLLGRPTHGEEHRLSHPAPAEPVGLREALIETMIVQLRKRHSHAESYARSFATDLADAALSTITRTDEAQS